jgi:predicted amidohydrolase
MKKIKAAAIQYEPIKGEKKINLKNIINFIIESSEAGSELIVLPEMCTTGYIWQNREEIKPYVENIPGYTTELISKFTKKYQNYVIIGLAEKDEKDIFYNSAALIGPEGYIGKYRKIHSFIADPMWAKDGSDEIPVFKTEIGNLGICICMDLNMPETTKVLYRKEADVICAPCNWTGEKTPSTFWYQRAYENSTPVIIANRWGEEKGVKFTGGSCIIDAKGELLNFLEKDNGCIYSELTFNNKKCKLPKYSFYKELMRNPYTWNPIWFYKQYDEKLPIGEKFKISSVQLKRERLINIETIKEILIENIKNQQERDSKIIVFPQNILNPIINNKVEITKREILDNIIGEISKHISEGEYILLSYLDKDEKSTAVLISNEGVVFKYKQIYKEDYPLVDIKSLDYYDTEYGRIGVVFGEELINIEFARILTLKGIDILLIPDDNGKNYNSEKFDGKILWTMAKSRSRENNIYTVYANYCKDEDNIGYSGIFGPNAFFKENEYIFSKFDEKILTLEIDTLDKSRKFPQNNIKYKPFMHSRKIDFYEELV